MTVFRPYLIWAVTTISGAVTQADPRGRRLDNGFSPSEQRRVNSGSYPTTPHEVNTIGWEASAYPEPRKSHDTVMPARTGANSPQVPYHGERPWNSASTRPGPGGVEP
eukprot:GHVU01227404.1.p2 GENE.GHVU01227404.1~~GHVU01227404.1.p2  ORF type:complete len:108 (-),score=2.06 GHVU01227404.1:150-473(-)